MSGRKPRRARVHRHAVPAAAAPACPASSAGSRRAADRLRARGPDPRVPLRTTPSTSRKRRSRRPTATASFNDFFTRRLRAGARRFDADPRAALCPADGTVSQAGPHRGRHAAAGQGHRLFGRGPAGRRRRAGGGVRGRRFRDDLSRAPQLSPRAHAPRRDAAPRALRSGRPVQRQCGDCGQRAGPVRPQRAHRLRLRHGGRAARRRAGRRAVRRQHEPCLGRTDPGRRAAHGRATCPAGTRSSRSTAAPSSAGSTWDRPWSCCSRRRVRRSSAASSPAARCASASRSALPR